MGEIHRDLNEYFGPDGRAADDDLPTAPTFGSFLVDVGMLNRYQLFQALQVQDQSPGTRLGDCIAALGFMHQIELETLHQRYAGGGPGDGPHPGAPRTSGPRAVTIER